VVDNISTLQHGL